MSSARTTLLNTKSLRKVARHKTYRGQENYHMAVPHICTANTKQQTKVGAVQRYCHQKHNESTDHKACAYTRKRKHRQYEAEAATLLYANPRTQLGFTVQHFETNHGTNCPGQFCHTGCKGQQQMKSSKQRGTNGDLPQ